MKNEVKVLEIVMQEGGFSWPRFYIEHQGEVIAHVNLSGCRNEKGFHGDIHDVWVSPEHRGKGLAKLLMAHAIETARNMDMYKLNLTCSPELKNLYGEFGFTPTSSSAMRLDL